MLSCFACPVRLFCSACSVLPVLSAYPTLPILLCLSCFACLVCLSCFYCPVLPVLFYLSVLFCISCFTCHVPACPDLAFMSWLSCQGSLVLPVPFLLPCSGCPVLAVLFCLSCSGCPVLAVLSWLSCPGCPVLAVLSWPYIDARARNYEREIKKRKCTSMKNRGARKRAIFYFCFFIKSTHLVPWSYPTFVLNIKSNSPRYSNYSSLCVDSVNAKLIFCFKIHKNF